jgi:hypothetical protein
MYTIYRKHTVMSGPSRTVHQERRQTLKMGITVAKTPKMMAMFLSVESALGTSRTMVAAKLVRTGCQFNCPEVQALRHAGGRVCWSGLVLDYGTMRIASDGAYWNCGVSRNPMHDSQINREEN